MSLVNTEDQPLIRAEDLSLGYESHAIVEGLNFQVCPGDYLCIVGENGSGKSTLMRTLLGLQKPISGRINLGAGLKTNQIGYLPQQTGVQRDFPASVHEIVMSGFQGKCGLRPFYTKEEKNQAAEYMEKMSVTSLADRCYRDLSGGQQQRVLLARALCAAIVAVVSSFSGIIVSILAGTPVGSTIVAVQIVVFAAFCAAGAIALHR